MKKICLLKYIDSKNVDGGQRVAVNLANTFCEKYEVYFVAMVNDGAELACQLNDNVNLEIIDMHGKRMRKIIPQLVKFLRSYFKKNEIKTVFSIGASMNMFAIFASIGLKIKTICCNHENFTRKAYKDRSQRLNEKLGVFLSDYMIVLTKYDRDAIKKKFPIRKSKVMYIYNWIDELAIKKEIGYNKESKRIMTVGRINPIKGIEDIVEIADVVLKEHEDWEWDIFGAGEKDYIAQIEALIKERKLENRLHLRGQVNNLYEKYQEYAFCVMTSKSEGLPMVLLEAKGSKLPLVSYDCLTGPSEIIQNEVDGYLVELGNTVEMIEKISYLIEHKETREIFSEHSQDNLQKFSKNIILKQWENLIEA